MKLLKKATLIASVVLGSSFTSNAQMLKEYSAFHRSVGISLGAMGIGVEGSYPIGQTFNVRAGVNYFPSVKISKPGTNDNANRYKFDRSNANLMLDWQPLFGGEGDFASKWFVTVGAGYIFTNELTAYRNNFREGKDPIYRVKFSQSPYLGTGLGNLVLGERIGLSLNLGYYFQYKGDQVTGYLPKVNLPDTDKFPQSVLKGLDAHATISYNF